MFRLRGCAPVNPLWITDMLSPGTAVSTEYKCTVYGPGGNAGQAARGEHREKLH